MAEVIPFAGWRYNRDKVGDLSAVLAPPYDVISEPARERFVAGHHYNIVRLTLGLDPLDAPPTRSRYELAAADLREWRREGVLLQDERPVFYLYEQQYHQPVLLSSQPPAPRRRRGVIAAVRLEEYDKRIILPHEGTLSAPKEDRRRLMDATQCAFSQVFGLYADPELVLEAIAEQVTQREPALEVTDGEGVIHRLWLLDDPDQGAALTRMFADKPIVIADGHHRYETALAYRDDQRAAHGVMPEAPWEYVSMYLCNTEVDQLTILPSHRLIKELPLEAEAQLWRNVMDIFETERVPIDTSSDETRAAGIHGLLSTIAASAPGEHAFGLYAGGNYALLLRLRDMQRAMQHGVAELSEVQRDLDVALLHKLLIEGIMGLQGDMAATGANILFSRDGHQAANRVARGEAAMVLFVNTTRVDQVMAVAMAGEHMPQKGTYFHPKTLSGLVLYDLRQS
jgi:uncharacterized protein (DUF1015 family)